jgi:superfamily II DNA or RNA helicase
MLILHAGLIDENLYIWGEKAANEAGKDGNRKPSEPGRLPLDAGGEVIRTVLANTLFDGSIRRQQPEMITAWLPTAGDDAVCSSPLLNSAPVANSKLKLAPWNVTALNIGLENTIGFLAACVNKELLDTGIMVGPDLAFWVKAVRFAGALVARQQYLPDLVEWDNRFHALWDPIFIGNDADYLNRLTRAMPHACRALSPLGTRKAPQSSPFATVSNYIVSVVDFLARHSIYSQPQATWPRCFREEDGEFDSLHDLWVNKLVSEDPVLPSERKVAVSLRQQIRDWRKPISLSQGTPFRLCLALEEPASREDLAAGRWFVHYHLQSVNNPRILIPADHVWNPTEAEAKLLNRDHFDAKEYLLSSLGQACPICPRIEQSLATDAPAGYEVDTAGAFQFLTDRVIALQQAGFATRVPDWWTVGGARHRLSTRAHVDAPAARKGGGATFSLNQVLNFDWEITLGGEVVSREELQELVKNKAPLINMRGRWVQLGADEIQKALDLISKKNKPAGSLRDIVQMALGTARAPGNFQFEGVTATGWVKDFLHQLEGDQPFELLPLPKGFKGELRPYQERGFSWLCFLRRWELGACLADDMGLGKTVQALTMVQHEWNRGQRKPTLVICPTSLTGNWQKEAQRFTPDLPALVHHGVNRAKGESFAAEVGKHAIVISSYSLLHRDIDVLKKIAWGACILDEAQNIKNPKTKQARSARSIEADFRVALTGTPVENNVGDLWSIMEFLNPTFLGSQAEFKRSFLMPIQASHEAGAVDKLKKLTAPFILRRLKTDKAIIKDLPQKMEMKVYCNLTKEQAGLYESIVREVENTLDSADGIQRKGLVLATLTKLKQICNHPAQYLQENSPLDKRSGKLSRLTEMLEEIYEVGDRALVFTQFVEMGKLVQQHLQETFGRETLFLHGGVSKHQRDEMIERFQNEVDGPHVFVLSLKAGGTGLNLTRANHVFHFDRWWNPAVEDQATDRVHRIGQTKNVQIHKFLCVGTLEEKIDDMIEAKKGLAASVVGSGESWLTELSTRELKKLFELQKDAIGE